MENKGPILTDLNKHDIKRLMLYLWEQAPKGKRTISPKEIIKLNWFKLPDELAKLYESATGKNLVSVLKQSHLIFTKPSKSGSACHIIRDVAEMNKFVMRHMKKRDIIFERRYDTFTIVSEKDGHLYNESLPQKFNNEKFKPKDKINTQKIK